MSDLIGNAVIGQSGGPTAVINESLVGAVFEAARQPAVRGCYGARHGIEGILKEDLVDLGAESVEDLEATARTPSAALGSVRRKPTRDDCRALVGVFKKYEIRYFFYIGGNDSAETAQIVDEEARKQDYEIRVCHIPKTIDNDLLVTDHCPGYGSAARFVALALMGDDLDNRALVGVKIDVVMGRHAGFLTAAAALGRQQEGDGPHLLYLPERPFALDRFCADVDRCLQVHGRCVVAVSEGIAKEDGSPIYTSGEVDAHGNVQLSGSGALGDFLAAQVKEKLAVKRVRADTLGYLQRCFPTVRSEIDAGEARAVGAYAVRALAEGLETSGSVAMRRREESGRYGCELFLTELGNVARRTRSLPDEFIAESGTDVTPAFRRYALPLVGELPRLGRLKAHPVRRWS